MCASMISPLKLLLQRRVQKDLLELGLATVAGPVSSEVGGGRKYLQKEKWADSGEARVQDHECQERGGGEQCPPL